MDAHANEYIAAVRGMADTYGTPTLTLPAIGERIAWRTFGMSHESCVTGHVQRVIEHPAGRPGIVVKPECGGDTLVIDPRPWPTGNVLPF